MAPIRQYHPMEWARESPPRLLRRPPLHEAIFTNPFAARAAAIYIIEAKNKMITNEARQKDNWNPTESRQSFKNGIQKSALRLANVIALRKAGWYRRTPEQREKILQQMNKVDSSTDLKKTRARNIMKMVFGSTREEVKELFRTREIVLAKILREFSYLLTQ